MSERGRQRRNLLPGAAAVLLGAALAAALFSGSKPPGPPAGLPPAPEAGVQTTAFAVG